MQLGIKIGLNNWKENLEKTDSKLCEIWFRIDWEEKYKEIFKFLNKNNIKTGLHFWGVLKNNIYPSILTDDNKIREESKNLIKKVIDIAYKNGFSYVNIHPEARMLFKLIFPEGEVIPLNKKTSVLSAKKYLIESGKELSDYSRKRNVTLLIETVPKLEPKFWWGKTRNKHPKRELINTYTVPSEWFFDLGKNGIDINLDVPHILTEIAENRQNIMMIDLKNKINKLAPYTKLLHVSTTSPPFNGSETHNGFTKKDYERGVLPGIKDYKDILLIIEKYNKDLWIIPEPEKNHIENFNILKKEFC